MKVNIKKLHANAVIPAYAHSSDAGLDMIAVSKEYDKDGNIVYGTGIAIAIPKNHVGYLFPRSSVSKKDITLANSVGVIDSGYTGEIIFKFKPSLELVAHKFAVKTKVANIPHIQKEYDIGDKIGQLIIMPIPYIEFIEVDELPSTDRGTGSFGSTDPITKSIEDNCQ